MSDKCIADKCTKARRQGERDFEPKICYPCYKNAVATVGHERLLNKKLRKEFAILTKKVETLRGSIEVNKEQVKKEFLTFEAALLLNQKLKTRDSLKELAEAGLLAMSNVAESLMKLEAATNGDT